MADYAHPPMEQLQDLEYCIDSNPPWAGINTLLQALFGTRLPAVVGGSFTYLIPIGYIISDASLHRISEPREDYFNEDSLRFMFPYPLQWGPPTFSAGHAFATMSAVIVSMVESTAAYKAASRLAIATPPPAYVLSRGLGWQGIGVLLGGLYGTGTGSTVSVENVGLLGLTRVGSRRVVQISAGFMIFFSTLGKFGAVFASIPFPIFAALYCILFGLVVQCILKHHIHVAGDRGLDCRGVPRQHSRGRKVEKRSRDAVVGEV
ncbi:Nucleobase-ascorbate transporter 1 [Senna tora]|uniref:Nucleobase-ascorbate transporter 1 n=1 Tax=Senna tora TaxID=362788 RepID=A0A834WBM6_9FABA|nr:Nucleobase-ascorbate transporter 1 [Senna tora]